MPHSSVLVLSTDSLLAALLGALIETLGFRPVFGDHDERPRDALLRLRPRAVLVDCEHSAASDESFLGPATMTGARVLIFGTEAKRAQLEQLAARHHLRYVLLPMQPDRLTRVLREALDLGVAS